MAKRTAPQNAKTKVHNQGPSDFATGAKSPDGYTQDSSPVMRSREPWGNHYAVGSNGNANSGYAALRRYQRMAMEIGGNAPGDNGRDRITLEHDKLGDNQ